MWSFESVSVAVFQIFGSNWVCGKKENNNIKDSTESRKTIKDSDVSESFNNNNNTRRLQLQATVKGSRFDLHLDLESQYTLISLWFQRQVS